jgi:integrase
MPTNRGTRHKPRWGGRVGYKGHKKWVGSFSTVEAYKQAASERLDELREEVDGQARREIPTVAEFAGASVDEPTGRVRMTWPEGQRAHKEKGRKASSERRLKDGLRPFLREFGQRPIDSFTRSEALNWLLRRNATTVQSVRQFFNHALDHELIETNHFTRIGASKRRRRVDRPDFQILTDEQYARLRAAARSSRADDYGLVLEGAILAVGEAAMRPGEVFALHQREVDFEQNVIHVRAQLDSCTTTRVWPKDDQQRWVVMSPALRTHLLTMPRYSETILFPAVRGGYMTQPNWARHWHAVRASAGMPAQEFYELKHRAIQWMIDPVEDGGLGLDPQTVAIMVGHDDGGYLISTVYTKLADRRAQERAQRAVEAYRERERSSSSHLRVVGRA